MGLPTTIVRRILDQETARRRAIVEGVAPIDPWENPANVLAEADERIAALKAKLRDGEKLMAWWNSVPARVRARWAEEIDMESES